MYAENVTYFDSFGVVLTKVYRMQVYKSIMCRYFCSGFIDFMLKGKTLLEYSNLFSPTKYEGSDKTILKRFQ